MKSVLVALVAVLALSASPAHAIQLESQAWWYDERSLTDGQSSHAHGGMDFPLFGQVSGTTTWAITSKIHNEPSGAKLDTVRVQIGAGGGTTLAQDTTDRFCYQHDCTFTSNLTVNWNDVPRGLLEVRIHSHVRRPNGELNLSTTGWWVYNRSGTSKIGTTNAVRFPSIEGRGRWDTTSGTQLGYENALLRSLPPTSPVCGVWRARVQTKAGSGGEPITSSRVVVDPNLHASPEDPGVTVLETAGAFDGYVDIDTSRLANGPHSLIIVARADESVPEHPSSRLAGVLRVPFTVDNTRCAWKPAVQMIWPDGATVTGVAGTSTDALLDAIVPANTTAVQYLLDGVRIASDSSGPTFDEFADVSAWTAGTHTLQARATIGGVVHESSPVAFTVVR